MPSSSAQLRKISLTCSPALAERIGDVLEEDAASVTLLAPPRKARAEVEALFKKKPDMAALTARVAVLAAVHKEKAPKIQVSPVGNLDWLKKVATDFPPITIARWTIYGAAHRDKVKNKRLALQIDATAAFGTGEHPTTRGCLEVLDAVLKKYSLQQTGRPIPLPLPRGEGKYCALDLGCGSGILAMAYAKACCGKVVAVDLDPEAVAIAAGNVRTNRLSGYIRTGLSNGYTSDLVQNGAPYGLIMANIFAGPLCQMAKDLKRHLAPDGIAILSGILNAQANAVISAHRAQGLHLIHRKKIGEWSVLALRRPLKA